MKRTPLAQAPCPVTRGYDAVGDWWSLLVVTHVVLLGRRRFGEIREELGVAKNILSSRLRKLVEAGVLERVPAEGGGAHHEYVATEKGRDLYKVLAALMQWGQKHCFEPGECRRELVERATGMPVAEIVVCSSDGRALTLDELGVEVEPEVGRG